MPHADFSRSRIGRCAARRGRGAARSGEARVQRERQSEILQARRILIPMMKSNYKWLVVGMLWFVCFFNYADRQAIFSVFPPIKGEMGLNDDQLGIVAASFMWVYEIGRASCRERV